MNTQDHKKAAGDTRHDGNKHNGRHNRGRGKRNRPHHTGDNQNGQNRPATDRQDNAVTTASPDTETATVASATQNQASQNLPNRPRRVHHTPRKPAELPDMDNLLIEDCSNDEVERGDNTLDDLDLESILQTDVSLHRKRDWIPDVIPDDKVVVVGVRFRTGGKTYFFDPGSLTCQAGEYAVVETARGIEFGEVCIANRMIDKTLVIPPLRPVIRIATQEDIEHNRTNREREEDAYRIGIQKIADHKLDMNLVAAQYTFDNSKLLFYFTAQGRVDFRELVKDLAGVFHIRIELRQIGIRDEARMIGGLGTCGRPLCCSTFLSDFGQVSMKMAKEQNLSLNSNKISGCCGRLMCCLRYEYETYAEEIRRSPALGTFVNTPDGPGVVTEIMPLLGEVKVSLRNAPDSAPKKYKRDDVVPQLRNASRSDRAANSEQVDEPDSDA